MKQITYKKRKELFSKLEVEKTAAKSKQHYYLAEPLPEGSETYEEIQNPYFKLEIGERLVLEEKTRDQANIALTLI